MPFTRREMLKFSAAGAASLLLPLPVFAALRPSSRRRKTLPILQGATDETRTQFAVVHASSTELQAYVTMPGGERRHPDSARPIRFGAQATAVTQFFFSGLLPRKDLTLTITNKAGEALDQRTFSTFDPKDESFKFAICSCMDEAHHEAAIWNDLAAQRPDVIFFIGDSVYTDKEVQNFAEARPETLWRRFAESRMVLEIYHQPRLTPILAVWDDHDFGNNDTNAVEYPYLKETKKNFLAYFPQDPNYCRFLDGGPGISSSFTFGDHQVVLMDDRSYRLPSKHGSRYAHWGQQQEEWALEKVRRHRGTTWLMNGSQFFPSVVWKESVSRNHPEQLAGFVQGLAKTRGRVIFASGDVHYSEISRLEPELLGYETIEVTSSSIHSSSFPGFPGIVPNPRRVLSTGERNYVLVKGKKVDGRTLYKVQSRSAGTVIRFETKISL